MRFRGVVGIGMALGLAFALALGLAFVGTSGQAGAQEGAEPAAVKGPSSGLNVPRFVSLKSDKVNVRRGPSNDQSIVWVFARAGLPVEIIAEADKEVTITLSTAREEQGQIMGEGDARRTRILGDSYGRDPSFAAFFRSMQAYERSLGDGETTLVLSPDSAFFRYFERGPSAGR